MCASTSSASPSTGFASVSTAGGWTCRTRSRTPSSGPSSGAAAGPSGPMPTSWARSGAGRPRGCAGAPEWLRGDRFDALMNYPLGAAILGFTGAHCLDRAVIATHHVYRDTIRPLDARSFGAELERLMTNYDPAVVAVQLNLIGSHDAPRALAVLARAPGALRPGG